MLTRWLVFRQTHLLHRGAVLQTAMRRCATGSNSGTSTTRQAQPINIDSFTINEEVVKQDMEALQRWNDLSKTIEEARGEQKHSEVLAAVDKGLAMLAELGPLNAPIQCETLLLLEAAQAQYNLQQFDDAFATAQKAKTTLLAVPAKLQDAAQLAEVNQLIGYILLKNNKAEEAKDVFMDVLRWIDVDAKTAMPMQAVAAVNMRRTIVTGIGLCHQRLAEMAVSSAGDGRELFGKALDLLIEALSVHIDENDFNSVKTTLFSVMKCFEGVGDGAQAISTAEKYVTWCSRHNDAEGVAEGTAWVEELNKKYNSTNTQKKG